MTHILAIDQSTSATKAVLFDGVGHIVDRAAREHRQIYPQAGWVEHDADEIWQNLLTVVTELVLRQGDNLANAAGVAITNQRETFVVFDRRSGRPLHNAIVWQCRRGDSICSELRAAGLEGAISNKTGLKLDTYFSAPKLKWLIGEMAELANHVHRGEAVVGTMDSYLIYRLTEGAEFATDPTNASRTLLYDIRRQRWDEELCYTFDVPMRALAEVRESFSRFGETDFGGILLKKLPICGVMGDSQASLFAQRCYEPGMAKATFGSGTSVLLNVGDQFGSWDGQSCPSPVTDKIVRPTVGSVTALAWLRDGHPVYALEGIINYSSATIAWLKDQLGLISDVAETASLARAVENNGGVYFVPAFSGLSAPYWSPGARAAIVGMTAHTRKEHIVRAALEAIAYQIRDVLETMRSEAGVMPRVLYADGGPTRNEFLMQFTANITGLELLVSEVAESSAWGAAIAGLLGLSVVESLAGLAELPRETLSYKPKMDPAAACDLYSGWQAAVKRVL
jgi:glycerol kinase